MGNKVSRSIYIDSTVLKKISDTAKREGSTVGDVIASLVDGTRQMTDAQVSESIDALREEINGLRRSMDMMMEFTRMCMKTLFRRLPGNNMLVRDCLENKTRRPLTAEELSPLQEENDRLLQYCLTKSGENVARFYWDDPQSDPFPDEVFVRTLKDLMQAPQMEDEGK